MKKAIIAIIVILIVIVGGYFIFSGGKSSDIKDLEKAMKNKDGINILGWLSSGKGVECKIDSPDGNIIVKAKNGKVRVEGMALTAPAEVDGEPSGGIYVNDGEWIYMWTGKVGTKMNIESIKEISGEEDVSEDDYSWQEWAEDWEESKINYDCKEKKLSDSLFEAPKDVDFKNLTEMAEKMQEISNDLLNKVDSGEDMSMEDIMEKFQDMNQEDIEDKLEELDIGSLKTNLQIEE